MGRLMVLITLAVSRTEAGTKTGTWRNGLYDLCGTFLTAPEQRHGAETYCPPLFWFWPGTWSSIRHNQCDCTFVLNKVLNSGLINSKPECIPVLCVPSAAVAVFGGRGVCAGWVSAWEMVSAQVGRGCLSRGFVCQTLPYEQNDRQV